MAINIGTIEGVLRLRDELSASLGKAANNIQNAAKFPKVLQASLVDLEKQMVKLSKTPSLRADAVTSTKAIAQINAQNRALAENIATIKKGPNAVKALNNERDIQNRLLAIGVTRESAFGKQLEASIRTQQKYKQQLADLNKVHKTFAERISDVGRSLAFYIGPQLIRTITLPIVALGGSIIKLSSDFESSFAGIIKTVDGVTDEFGNLTKFGAELSQGMRDLSKTIPINVNELNRIGESAGQLGIKKEAILGFTRTVADMGVTTNLSTEAAATGLARLANITQLPQEQFDRLGSTIVDLGNKFAGTESEILEMGLRIAGAGEVAGLTEAQILSIGTALTSLGIEAEAGGTAVQKVLIKITKAVAQGNKDLQFFAATAGKSSKEFSELWKRDAGEAFRLFVEGLGQQGQKAFNTLDALHLKDVRLTRAFISLATSGDLLNRTMAVGTKAFADNTALTTEAEKRYKTFASQLTLTWNKIKDIAIELGKSLLPILRDLLTTLEPAIKFLTGMANAFNSMPKGVQLSIIAILAFAAAVGPVIYVVGQLALAIGSIITVGKALLASTAFASAAAKIGAALSTTGPIGVAIVALGLLINYEISQWKKRLTELQNVIIGFREGDVKFAEMQNKLRDASRRGSIEFETLQQAAEEVGRLTREYIDLVATKIPEATEKSKHKLSAEAAQAKELLVIYQNQKKVVEDRLDTLERLIKKTGNLERIYPKEIKTKVVPFELPTVPNKEAETALRRVRETIEELKLEAKAAEEVYKAHARGGAELSEVEKGRQKGIEKIIELENLLKRTGQSLTEQQKKDILEATVTTAKWGVELDELKRAEKEFVDNLVKSAVAMRNWSAAGQDRKEKIQEQTIALQDSIAEIQREIKVLGDFENLKGLDLERALGLAKVEDGIDSVVSSIKRLTGETEEAFNVRMQSAIGQVREALMSLANTEFAINVRKYLEEPIIDFAETVKSQLSNAITDVIVDGKLEFDDLWKSFLRSALDALQKWIVRYIAVQRMAQAESARTAMINAAASQGGQLGGVTGITGSSSGAIGMTGGTSAAAGGTAAAQAAGSGWSAYGVYASYAFFAWVGLKIFEGWTKKKTTFGEASLFGNQAGSSKISRQMAEVVEQIKKEILSIVDQWHLGIEKLGNITIGQTSRGEIYVKTLIDSFGKFFKTMEEAVEYAKVQAIKFAEFSESTSAIVRAAISGSRATDISGLGSNIDFARMLETQNMADIANQMSQMWETATANLRRVMDLFRGNFEQMVAGAGSVITNFMNGLHQAYNSLMGIKEDPRTVWERNKQAYNLQLVLMKAQILLLYEEIKAKIILLRINQELIRGLVPGSTDREPPGGDQIDGPRPTPRQWWTGGALKGGQMPPGTEPAPTNQLSAFEYILRLLADALRNLPPEITGGMPRGAGGGRGGGTRGQVRDFISDRRFELSLNNLTDYQRALKEIDRQYQDLLKQAGKDKKLRQELMELKEEELRLLSQEHAESTIRQFREFLGLITPFDQIRETAEDLIKNIEGSPFGDVRKAAMIGRVLSGLEKQLDKLSKQESLSLFGELLQGLEKYGAEESQMSELRRNMAILEHMLNVENYRDRIEMLKAEGRVSAEIIAAMESALGFIENVNIDEWLKKQAENIEKVNMPSAREYADAVAADKARFNESVGKVSDELNRLAEAFRDAKDDIRSTLEEIARGDLGIVSPLDAFNAAKEQYEEVLRKAKAGELLGFQESSGAAKNFIEALKKFSPSLAAVELPRIQNDLNLLLSATTVKDENLIYSEKFVDNQAKTNEILTNGLSGLLSTSNHQSQTQTQMLSQLQTLNNSQAELNARLARLEASNQGQKRSA